MAVQEEIEWSLDLKRSSPHMQLPRNAAILVSPPISASHNERNINRPVDLALCNAVDGIVHTNSHDEIFARAGNLLVGRAVAMRRRPACIRRTGSSIARAGL
jgi:hypothetical protein